MSGVEERRALSIDAGWAGPLITALAAGAYLLGYLETAFFASALGVTARDLGIDVKDYAVLALANVVLVAIAAAAVPALFLLYGSFFHAPGVKAWLDSGDTALARAMRWIAIRGVGLLGALTINIVGLWGMGLDAGVITGSAVVWVSGLAYMAFQGIRSPKHRFKFSAPLLLGAVVGTFALACFSADSYAERLRRAARDKGTAPMPPPALRTVLQPEVGVATQGDKSTCAVRVSPDVLLGRDAVTVGTSDRFIVQRCHVVDVPFS